MARAVISYDKDLPEIPDRLAHEPPTSFLRKKKGSDDEFEIVEGRRPSNLLLINKLRKAVEDWRASGYEGESSEVTRRLFNYWFDEDHIVNGKSFRYYYAQREAVETIIYLLEEAKIRDSIPLIEDFGQVFYPPGTQQRLSGTDFNFHTMKGKRQIARYIPDTGEAIQDLPPEDLRRYAFKMATGSGKTLVMSMMMVWSYFHKLKVEGSDLSKNFLIVAPNVIVYQRLEKDFESNRIFHELPLIPPEWLSQWNLKVILRGDSAEPDPSGNLFLTNVHQIYGSRESDWTPINAVDALLGKKPVKDLSSNGRSMLERIKSLKDLVVMNDEAHHVHDEHLEWYKSLTAIQGSLPSGISLWMDFSATPKDPSGSYFPWIICDYPLAQAVEDRIVKAPLIVHRVRHEDPKKVTRENALESYEDWLRAALARWREHYDTYQSYGVKPVLFIMAENNGIADEIGRGLVEAQENSLHEREVLVIHTDNEGEITKKDLERARDAAKNIDNPESPIKVIVSVLMLREGWDVRNVSVVLGLRPFTSKAKILPEQAIGRGLRLMSGIGPDRTQTLEVMGTQAFEDFVRVLEIEGLGIKTDTGEGLKPPVKIEPIDGKRDYDINIPLTMLRYTHNYKRISDLDPSSLKPISDQEELGKDIAVRFIITDLTTEAPVHVFEPKGPLPLSQALLSLITKKAMGHAKLVEGFAEIYPIVREYVTNVCFGQKIDLENENVRLHLREAKLQDVIARYLARKIGELVAESRPIEFDRKDFKLSDVEPFSWRRNLPLLACSKTIFNLVATYNPFEKDFAGFLERCSDIIRFASLGTTEQESGTQFKVDYIKPSGAIGLYYPDWVAVQKTDEGEVNWIIETKGRVYEGTEAKDASIDDWCKNISAQTGAYWRYIRVNQVDFEKMDVARFEDLLKHIGY